MNLIKEPQPVIFDIGAYKGETVRHFKFSFPESSIHVFEPINESFSIMKNKFQKTDGMFFNNIAIGDSVLRLIVFILLKIKDLVLY